MCPHGFDVGCPVCAFVATLPRDPREQTPVRDYLVDQLVIAASHLTESHIFRKDPSLPLCQLCLMTGHNGRPIPHLPSCAVGRVLRAIEDLKQPVDRRPLTSWDHGDFASSRDGVAQRTESAGDVDAYLDAKDVR